MGVVRGVNTKEWPEQSEHVGFLVRVCFGYDTSATLAGRLVRDDVSHPFETIIRLEDGRHVLGTECQYSVVGKDPS